MLTKKHRYLSYSSRTKRVATGYCNCRETFNDSGNLIQFTEKPSNKWHLPMQLFSQFRPEVEELKACSMGWEDKVNRYGEKYNFTPYPAQVRAAVDILRRDSVLLGADCGAGKTLLATLYTALRTTRRDTVVVVAPRGVHPQWQAELSRFSGRRATCVERPESLAAGINLINIEAFRRDGLKFNRDVTLVIADECHFLANASEQTTGFLECCYGVPLRVGLTGTAIPNRVEELFLLLGWLSNPTWATGTVTPEFPYAVTELERFKLDHTLSGGEVGLASPERLATILRPLLVTLSKSECRPDLPPLNLRFVPCSTPTSVMQSWEKCFRPGTPSNIEMDFLTATSHCRAKVAKVWGRLLHLLKLGEQVMVVSVRTEPLTLLTELLKKRGTSTSTIYSEASTEYAIAAEAFSNGGSRVILMGMKCAQAYSFPNCAHVLIIGSDFTYGMFYQALCRCHRLNSLRPVSAEVFYYRGTNEAVALETVMAKAVQASLVFGEREFLLDARIPNDRGVISDDSVERLLLKGLPEEEKSRAPIGISVVETQLTL